MMKKTYLDFGDLIAALTKKCLKLMKKHAFVNHFQFDLQGPLSLSDPAHSHRAGCSGVCVSSFYLCLVVF